MLRTAMMWLIAVAIAVAIAAALVLSGGDGGEGASAVDAEATADASPTPLPNDGGSSSDAEPEPTATTEPEPTATAEPEPTATEEPEPLPVIPQGGPWRVVNQPATFLCGGTSIEVPETVEEGAMLTILDDGENLLGLDFSADATDLNMHRTAVSPVSASYAGDVSVETPDGTVTISFSVTFNSPTHFDGDLVGTVSGGGILCEIDRGLAGDFKG